MEEGLEELCKLDEEYCAQIDMEAYAKREVKAEIYAIQTYDNFGCAACSTLPPVGSSGVEAMALIIAVVVGRRALTSR